MFGFLKHCHNDPDYRRAYRRCCQFQHIHYGVASLPLFSYEAVFLYQLGLDLGLACNVSTDSLSTDQRKCCRLQASRRMLTATDSWLAIFAVSFGVLLGKIKIDDDVRDNGRLAGRVANRLLKRKHRDCLDYFQLLDPAFERNVDRYVFRHHQLEKPGTHPSLDSYSQPTADAFAYLFGLMVNAGRRHGNPLTGLRQTAASIGQWLGRAIIAFDCAVDYENDKRNADFNPLPNQNAVQDALSFSNDCLVQAGEMIAVASGRGYGTVNRNLTANLAPTERILRTRARLIERCLSQTWFCFSENSSDVAGDPDSTLSEKAITRRQSCWDCHCDVSCCFDPNGCGFCHSANVDASVTEGGCCNGSDCDCGDCDCGC